MRKTVFLSLLAAAIVTLVSVAANGPAPASHPDTDDIAGSWISAGNGPTNDHLAALDRQIGTWNVPHLYTRWVLSADGEVQGTPAVDGLDVFFADAGGSVWRVDAATATVIWKVSLPACTGNSKSFSRNTPALAHGLVILGDQGSGTLLALSRDTGRLLWKKVLSSAKGAIITGSPVVVGDRIFVGVSSKQEEMADKVANFVPTFRGSMVAVDLDDGAIVWQTHTVPEGYTGGSVFGNNEAVDVRRSLVFFGTGNNYSVPPAVHACQLRAKSMEERDECNAPDDHIDSIMAVDMRTGAIRWSDRLTGFDTWTVSCSPTAQPAATPCPVPTGQDADFAAGPNLFTIRRGDDWIDAVGIGKKSGGYYAVDRDTGKIIWATQAGPGGNRGGIEWSTATDGRRIYIPNANSDYKWTTLVHGEKTNGGYWSALDAATGRILWETPTSAPAPMPLKKGRAHIPPPGARAETEGSVSLANGVLYGEDAAGTFVALEAATGRILWTYRSDGAGISGPAIAGNSLYWSSGYKDIGPTSEKLHAFSVPNHDS